MILSIGMIVKNEERNLRKCLKCLKPILEQVHSELIIADTGSKDGTVAIAKEFTNRVFQIEWRDDFAWARNQTLERARGKWFMFVDADEFFQDAAELIEFFNSGEYRDYASASHLREELSGRDDGLNALSRPGRMFKMWKGIRFEGIIHEYIPQKRPHKYLKCVSLHEGYDFTGSLGKKKRREKHERNLVPLLILYDENPKDKRTLGHLINQYFTGEKEDMLKVKDYIDQGLALYENGEPQDIFYHAFHHKLTTYYGYKKEHEKVVKAVGNYFDITEKHNVCAIDMRMTEALSLASLEKYEESAAAYIQAMDYREQYERGLLEDNVLGVLSLKGVAPKAREAIASGIINSYSAAGDFAAARLWADKPEGKGADIFLPYAAFIIRDGRPEDVTLLYNYLTDNFALDSEEYEKGIAAIERSTPDAATKRAVCGALLAESAINNVDGDYIRLQRLRKEYEDDGEGLSESLSYFLNSDKGFSQVYGDVIAAAMKLGVNFVGFLEKMKVSEIGPLAEGFARTNSGIYSIFLQYLKDSRWLENNHSVKCANLMQRFAVALLRSCHKREEDNIIALFEAFARLCYKYSETVTRKEVFCEDMIDSLSESEQFVFYAHKAYSCRDNGDTLGFVSNLRVALKRNPQMKDFIQTVIDKLSEELEEEDEKAAYARFEVRAELNKETVALKNIIYGLINDGNFAMAEQVLAGYAQANPADPDIEDIEELINAGGSGG